METKTAKISCLKLHGYRIELSENMKGLPVAKCLKLLTAGKNKGEYKQIEGFYFRNEERRNEWVKKTIEGIKQSANIRQARAELKKNIRSNMDNPFKEGDILYDSWGYEQTNIDFYQVIEVKAKSVLIQRIGKNFVDGSEGFMSANVIPNPEHKIGSPELKHVQFYLSGNIPHFYIKSEFGSIGKYNKEDKGVYCSWYA